MRYLRAIKRYFNSRQTLYLTNYVIAGVMIFKSADCVRWNNHVSREFHDNIDTRSLDETGR